MLTQALTRGVADKEDGGGDGAAIGTRATLGEGQAQVAIEKLELIRNSAEVQWRRDLRVER